MTSYSVLRGADTPGLHRQSSWALRNSRYDPNLLSLIASRYLETTNPFKSLRTHAVRCGQASRNGSRLDKNHFLSPPLTILLVADNAPPPEYADTIQCAAHHCSHCGRRYTVIHHLDTHQRKCKRAKSHLKDLLGSTRAFWETKKRARLTLRTPSEEPTPGPSASNDEPMEIDDAPSQSTGAVPLDKDMAEVPEDLDTPIGQRKGGRQKRLPKRYRDDPPEEPRRPKRVAQSQPPPDTGTPATTVSIPTADDRTFTVETTDPNIFGVTRTYSTPDGIESSHILPLFDTTLRQCERGEKNEANQSTEANRSKVLEKAGTPEVPKIDFGPLTNESAFYLAEWYWGSTNKSFCDFQRLMAILKRPSFDLNGIININWATAFKALGQEDEDVGSDGWKCTPISINVPFHRKMKNSGIRPYSAGNFYHRSIVSVIKEKVTDPTRSHDFHSQPYEEHWQRNGKSPEVELYGELYGSRAFRQANDAVQRLPSTDKNRGMERIVVALMFWSDATHLTAFGTAILWPCYLFFGNESKDQRCKPSAGLGHQIAYFMKLPNNFNDYLKDRNGGKMPKKELISHCARELFHAQWSILLDQELVNAMKDGLVVACSDGHKRCFYPRILTYSADYPERLLVAGIRNNGNHPCHRCLVDKLELDKLGAPNDTDRVAKPRDEAEQAALVTEARQVIDDEWAFDGTKVEAYLFPQSLTAVENTFYKTLSPVQFSVIPSLVADLMHEFEIGVWKNLYIHLIRILHACPAQPNTTLWAELDWRYRATPTFGKGTIRKFSVNASEMKRKAARDYEDLLQCAIPAFEGLLPSPHNDNLLTLLYICAQWHALAKLRMHNDFTLELLEYTTIRLGAQMRLFHRDTCSHFETKELDKEAEARVRRDCKKSQQPPHPGSTGRKPTSLGVFTIKFHLLGDYCNIIRMFGATDSFSTELGESFHRTPKSWYPRTDKKHYENQFAQMERRIAHLARIRGQINRAASSARTNSPPSPEDGEDTLLDSPSDMDSSPDEDILDSRSDSSADEDTSSPDPSLAASRYHMGVNQNTPIHISNFQDGHDTAYGHSYFTDFVPKLKTYLLPRILHLLGCPPAAEEQCNWTKVTLEKDRVYSHKTMRIRYTTYNVRREEDVIHVDTPQCNVMLLDKRYNHTDPDSPRSPYMYGKIIGILHANVSYIGTLPDGRLDHGCHRVDFGWIHWYDSFPVGEELRLDRVALSPLKSVDSVGFVDPVDIIRGVHLIPRFSSGPSNILTPPAELVKTQKLWKEYYVNRFADRDLFMRYQFGMSVGHTYMHGSDFPPATIPSLPADFDYCLDHEKRAKTQASSSSDSPPGAELRPSSGDHSESPVAAANPNSTTDEDGDENMLYGNEPAREEQPLPWEDMDWERDSDGEMDLHGDII